MTPIHYQVTELTDESATLVLGAYRSKPAQGYRNGNPRRKKIAVSTSVSPSISLSVLIFDPKKNPELQPDETYEVNGCPLKSIYGTNTGRVFQEFECGPSCEVYIIAFGISGGAPDTRIIEWFE